MEFYFFYDVAGNLQACIWMENSVLHVQFQIME